MVFVTVRDKNFHLVDFDDFLVLKSEIVAISFYSVKAFMAQKVAERTYAVAQKNTNLLSFATSTRRSGRG